MNPYKAFDSVLQPTSLPRPTVFRLCPTCNASSPSTQNVHMHPYSGTPATPHSAGGRSAAWRLLGLSSLTARLLVRFVRAVRVVVAHPGERHTLARHGTASELLWAAHLALCKQHNNMIQRHSLSPYVHWEQFFSSNMSGQSACLSHTHAWEIHTPAEHWNSPSRHGRASAAIRNKMAG